MARDSDNALVCCVENTVEDRIMDYGASFHATYFKEELERFKLRSGKVRLAGDKTLDIASVGDVVLKTSFDQEWKVTKGSLVVAHGNKRGSLYMVEVHPKGIGAIINGSGSAAVWFWEAEKSFLHNVTKDKETAEVGATGVANGIVMLKMVPKTPLQFGVAERLSRTFRAESTGIRPEAPKMLWAESVSTTYLIYRIPYVLIGLRIPEEEWRGKDTSLTHLKVFGCDSFVKVKDVCGEAMKYTFIGNGSNEMRYSFRDMKSHRKSQVVLVDIPENLVENDSIVEEHGLSSEITQSLGGSSDTSDGSENSGSFEDSGRSDEEDSKDKAFSEEGGSETPQVRRSTRESRAPVRYSPSANYLLRTENGEADSYSEALNYQQERMYHKACGCSWLKKSRMAAKGTRLDWWLRFSNRNGFSLIVKMTTIRLVLSIVAVGK
ncbi:hypothetical protein Tco_0861293 [Tanacetum coccineum]|uniref:Retrovirus-related Pol polyprotein from transposon TNT 1-94 n=1 Tax=Tanacetum coccineum TaxID=301880 RepID=A0ABQ5BKR6_9ASTR